MWIADFEECCTRPNQTSFTYPSLALPSPASRVRRREAQRHICTFVISEWIVFSMCFSWSVVGNLYCLCFCWQLSFNIVRLIKDQVDSETRDHCRIGFLCGNWPRKLSGLKFVFLDITDKFLIILFCILHLPVPFSCLCGLKCQFYKAEISSEWFLSHLNVPKGYVGKGYFDILDLSVLFSFIILVLYLAKTLLILPPKDLQKKKPSNRLACSQ